MTSPKIFKFSNGVTVENAGNLIYLQSASGFEVSVEKSKFMINHLKGTALQSNLTVIYAHIDLHLIVSTHEIPMYSEWLDNIAI